MALKWFWLPVAAFILFPFPTLAANLLSNPGFEFDLAGENHNLPGWTSYGANTLNETGGSIAQDGTNYFKIYQAFNGSVNYNGIYQDYISGPGATYTAGGWTYTSATDALAGGNVAWIEISFRDAAANILALYRSATITTNQIADGAFPKNTWVYLPVTNQLDSATFQITNHSNHLIAPAGTYFVRLQIVFQGDANYSGGSMYFDDLNLSRTGGAAYGDWNITWSDEFNSNAINTNIWTYDTGAGGWGNNELEYYTRRATNAYVTNGCLHIVARQESYHGQNYTSARLKSQGLFSSVYGRYEWRAKLPSGLGYWPALWMLGTNITTVGWPGCGEIDVVEAKGSLPDTVQGSLHSGSDETAANSFFDGDSITNFHTYTLDWATNAILFYVDGHLYESQTSWGSSIGNYPAPFDQPFFFIMNIAVGGNYLGNPGAANINANTVFPGEMLVDYVRVYNQTQPLAISISRTNSTVLLRWPSNVICHLQSESGGLDAQIGWTDLDVTSNPFLIRPTNSAAFYRLSSP